MADLQLQAPLKLLENTKIIVNVEEALQDILIVSYPYESKLFKGVLLDLNKRNLPFGIFPPPGGPSEDEKLHTLVQRYTYFQTKNETPPTAKPIRRPIRPPARYRTVRLRPRQVLCSKCSSICNENSENVDFSQRKRRSAGNNSTSGVNASSSHSENTRNDAAKSPRPLLSDSSQLLNQSRTSLIPKLSRLQPNEISNALNGKTSPKEFWQPPVYLSPRHTIVTDPVQTTFHESSESSDDEESKRPRLTVNEENESENGRVLRKKKSVGSMEDLWDESVFEDKLKAKRTPIIKISYGSQGEGTILKIPAKVSEADVEESETEQLKLEIKEESEQDVEKTSSAKAAKRALKKAKKAARRKLANNSPSYESAAAIGNYEDLYRRKHKHKMKHKKKHKEDRRLKEEEEDEGEHEETSHNQWCDGTTNVENSGCGGDRCEDEAYTAIKERCLKQKLSINLKRLNAKAYAPTSTEPPDQPIAKCSLPDGRVFAVGDVVWGKLHGCPWWPGKVETLTLSSHLEMPQAHVSWYNSKTSSVIGCDQLNPFLKSFKSRFNKKKRGPYKEAIRQATLEANRDEIHEPPSLLTLASSPPQVNVLS